MVNPEHLKILEKGVKAWNQWRKDSPEIKPDLMLANLSGADLRRADLSEADARHANLSRADLRRADLSEADVRHANLSGANLGGVLLNEANLYGANLHEADLHKVNLIRATLTGTDLRKAALHEAYLSEAYLHGANLREADFREVIVGFTTFANVDLSVAKGLETVKHEGPSTIGIDTIYRSQGKIPEIFLRGAGVGDEFIALIKSLAGAIQFYSCFISYSSKDQEFAERLYADLQARGVRCWFAPEDLKIGDKFRQSIDDAIRFHDKLLVVLSKASVNSTWVEKEVLTAFEREKDQEGKPVLFPIRLDEAVMKASPEWAGDIRRTRHIGDFSKWQDHNFYQRAFQRLLRDLKGETGTQVTAS